MVAIFCERLPHIERAAGKRAHRPVDQVQSHRARRPHGYGSAADRMPLVIHAIRSAEVAQALIAVVVPHTAPARATGPGTLPAQRRLRNDASRALARRPRTAEPIHAPSPADQALAPPYSLRTAEPADPVSRAFSTAADRRARGPRHDGARRPSSSAAVLVRGLCPPASEGPRGAFAARSGRPQAMAAPS